MNKNLIGENIKAYRELKKLTRKELAKEIGISDSTLAGYENGHRLPNVDILIKLSDYLDVSMDYLSGRSYEDNEVRIYKDKIYYLEKEIYHLKNDIHSLHNRIYDYEKLINDSPSFVNEIISSIEKYKTTDMKNLELDELKKILDEIPFTKIDLLKTIIRKSFEARKSEENTQPK